MQHRVKTEVWRRSFLEFLTKAVKIEDRDVVGLAIPFELWPKQMDAAQAIQEQKKVIVLKARQLGLTWLVLAYALWKMLYQEGFSVVALSKREDPDAKELIRRLTFILKHLPCWLIQEKGNTTPGWNGKTWETTSLSLTIKYGSRTEPSVFQSMTSSPDSGRSFTANLVMLDEWAFQQYAEEIWSAAYPVINRPTGGQVIGLSTGNPGTLFHKLWDAAMMGENTFYPVFLPWWSDPRRDEDWYTATKKDLPNTYRREYPAVPEDAWAIGEGAFFPQWDVELHAINEIGWYPPDYCQIEAAYDAGYGSRACFKWYAVFPDGDAICYREYYPTRTTDDEQAKEIKRLSKRPDGNEEYIHRITADPSCWNKQSGSGESTAEVFIKNGLVMIPADNDLSNGWRRLHQWLNPGPKKKPHLSFTYSCANTIRTYPACKQSKTNPEDISRTSEHHAQDVDRYFVMSRPQPREEEAKARVNVLPPELRDDTIIKSGWVSW